MTEQKASFIQATPTEFVTYAVVRCADVERDEHLNIAVVVLDLKRQRVTIRSSADLSRVQRAFPSVAVGLVGQHLSTLSSYLEGLGQHGALGADLLRSLSEEWAGVLRLSTPMCMAASSPEEAARTLFERYVEMTPGATATPSQSGARVRVTSRRLVRQVETRLRRRGFEAGRDFQQNAELDGLTLGAGRVPVWFPLFVSRRLLIDTMWVDAADEERSVDGARLLAAKSGEILRSASELDVAVVLGPSRSADLDALVERVVSEEGRVGERYPSVYWQHDVSRLAEGAPRLQLAFTDDARPMTRIS